MAKPLAIVTILLVRTILNSMNFNTGSRKDIVSQTKIFIGIIVNPITLHWGGALQLTCYVCRCRPAGCLFWNIRYRPGYLFPKIWYIPGYAFFKKCCNIGYTVLALLYILLYDALKVTYY